MGCAQVSLFGLEVLARQTVVYAIVPLLISFGFNRLRRFQRLPVESGTSLPRSTWVNAYQLD